MPLLFNDRAYFHWYVKKELALTPPGSSVWGSITGTIGAQNDLMMQLNSKANTLHLHEQGNVTNLVTDLAGKEPANANIQAHVTSAHAPSDAQKNSNITKAEIEAKLTGEISTHTHPPPTVVRGVTLNVQALTSSPVDAQTIYFGNLPKAPVTTGGQSKVYIRATCTIKAAEIYCYSGTAGSNQAWSLYIRKNNTTDTLIATLSVATNERVFSNTSLAISMVSGDYFELKSINPTWVTNPLTTIFGGYVYVE